MPTKDDELLADLLKLPVDKRAELAHELLLSLDEEPGEDAAEVEAAWTREIERRAEEVLSGSAKLVDAHEALRDIEARLRARRTAK